VTGRQSLSIDLGAEGPQPDRQRRFDEVLDVAEAPGPAPRKTRHGAAAGVEFDRSERACDARALDAQIERVASLGVEREHAVPADDGGPC
jgi:hypothetical protein